ncbi:hypothetical protein CQA49_06875 [Helicobacter sp. MIT 00-7814]|uniref:hypothetical protein n=1 Tax=unclassified Helicobacter TaxID=2593540 RepID=UPI000E1E34EA|nr:MULTISPECIES: hypothetical protein [unclassified Helicobacter]RDU53365.1 hypothetical protein CQA49_06875 [Helicobacter sp. MIT 00-7814]RDU54186.1 hypothetical protein CQA37_06115 [Helicobacter sp. MIT 99-10781]
MTNSMSYCLTNRAETIENKNFVSRIMFLFLLAGVAISLAAGTNPFEFIKNGFFQILEEYIAFIVLGILWITIIMGIGFGGLPWLPAVVTGIALSAGLFLYPGVLSGLKEWAKNFKPTSTVGT